MRILLGHSFPERPAFGAAWIGDWLARLRAAGFDVHPFSLVFDPQRPVTHFRDLDALWRYRDPRLRGMYERLADTLADYDVFVCFNGSNVHPQVLPFLKRFCVYACFDDPESSHNLSRPVASAFDVAMVGNIAELDAYRSWGVRQVRWWPLGFRADDYRPALTEQEILEGRRDVGVALLCERVTRFRKGRVDEFARAFPDGAYYGQGWPAGFLPEASRVALLQNTRVGINIHNSTGPVNFRTFYLPANGVMQICDNKRHLGRIFDLGREVVGYDTIDEAVELTRYYLHHEEERRRIAAAGWKRALRDYNEVACFQRLIDTVHELQPGLATASRKAAAVAELRRLPSPFERVRQRIGLEVWLGIERLRRRMRSLAKKLLYGS
ncbi:MAG TPA: glycosyltransferase [Burkholderiales bacterium]|jgi:hypothetical protein